MVNEACLLPDRFGNLKQWEAEKPPEEVMERQVDGNETEGLLLQF